MLKYALFALAVAAVASCDERALSHKHVDPFAALDKHISHTLAYHYLWPWNQLIRAAAALDAEEYLEEPKIVSDAEKYEVHMNVKKFKPEELKIRIKNRNIVVEGKHQEKNQEDNIPFVANHFVQRFVLPPGSKQEEVTAIFKENGVLTIAVPKHTLPPPPPEREVPIEVLVPDKKEEKVTVQPETEKDIVKDETNVNLTTEKEVKETKKEEETKTTEKAVRINEEKSSATAKDVEQATVTNTPLEQLDMIEATTNHVGKIRKKELKDTVKAVMDNEVVKSLSSDNQNGLDYALIEE